MFKNHVIPSDEQSDDEDGVLNENITEDEKVQAMKQSSKIMSKFQNKLHVDTCF